MFRLVLITLACVSSGYCCGGLSRIFDSDQLVFASCEYVPFERELLDVQSVPFGA